MASALQCSGTEDSLRFDLKPFLCSVTLSVCLIAQSSPGTLTNQKIAELMRLGVQPTEIIRIIQSAPTVDFDLRPVSTDALMKAGVSEELIKAMAARENGAPVSGAGASALRAASNAGTVVKPSISEIAEFNSKDWVLHEGTPIRLRLMRTVSSATAQEGENVDFETLDDISVNGVTVIPRNSTALATVTAAESKKRMGRGGKLGMNIDYVRLPSGEKLALRGVQDLKAGGHVGAMTGAMVGTAIVFWPAAPFFLFMHGKDISIPEGHEVRVYTNSDYKVVPARF